MLIAFLEHTALRLGVLPRPPDASMGPLRTRGSILWSAVPNATTTQSNYTQVLADKGCVLHGVLHFCTC
jgi:hypothetical protein